MTTPFTHILQFDGGARGNPGPAAGAAVLFALDGTRVFELAVYLPHATNNLAEYAGLEEGLTRATEHGIRRICIQGDSLLVIQQIAGDWKVKNEGLKKCYSRVMKRLQSDDYDYVEAYHIPRDQNAVADRLVNEAIDQQHSFYRITATASSH